MYYLGGHTLIGMGRLHRHAVYVDFVSQFTEGYNWQLYANRKLIGSTRSSSQRRVIGQLMANVSPAPLVLVRVDASNWATDYGDFLPVAPWNRFTLSWSTSGSSGIDHFDVVSGDSPGASIDMTNVLAKVKFTADGPYSFEPNPLPAGVWQFGIVPRTASTPSGLAGSVMTTEIDVVLPPNDVTPAVGSKARFTAAAVAGNLTVGFNY